MCIIIDNRAALRIPDDVIDNCLSINPDGFGFYRTDTGKLQRSMSDRTMRKWLRQRVPFIAHCRYATIGIINRRNVHPAETPTGGFLFQNGTVDGLALTDKQSDVRKLAQLIDFVRPKDREAFLSSFTSRFVYVSPAGEIIRTGDWIEQDGVFYSKRNVLHSSRKRSAPPRGFFSDYFIEEPDMPDSHTVAVYGTLKQGYGNHRYLETADFIDHGETADPMRLCIDGLPYLIDGPHLHGIQVDVEVYSVDDNTLAELDCLEGHPTFYERKQMLIETVSHGEIYAWVYVVDETRDNGSYHQTYCGR